DPLFDGLQVEPHHACSVLTRAIPSGTTDIRASARVDGGRRAARVPSIRCYRWGYAGGRRPPRGRGHDGTGAEAAQEAHASILRHGPATALRTLASPLPRRRRSAHHGPRHIRDE